MKYQQRWSIVLLACVASAGLFVGCDDHRDSAIIPPPQPTAAPQPAAQQQPPAPPQRQIVWQLPMSWKDAPTTQPGEMAVQVSQSNPELLLRGQILGNSPNLNLVTIVNAWEKMLGRTPSDPSAVEGSIVKPYIANDLRGHLVDLGMPDDATDRRRLLGAVFPDPLGVTMAFTLLGPDEQVAAQRENFRQFLDSLRMVTVQQQTQQSAGAVTPFRLKYLTPPNWTVAPAVQGVDLELRTGDPAKPVRLVVTRMAVETANTIVNEPNTLRSQAGLAPLAAGDQQLRPFKVGFGAEQGLMYDLQSPAGETPRRRTLFAMCAHGGMVVCVQLGGPAEQVDAHLPELETFLKSIEFIPVTQ